MAGITLNKNTIPNEPCSPFHPSGIRMGTPIMTMRGMKENEMKQVASWMKQVFDEISHFDYLEDKEARKALKKEFQEFIRKNEKLRSIK